MPSTRGSIIAIVGPTGVGKTKLSVTLALALTGEVVSVDSLQVYCDGKILTAQATREEMKGVRHHLIDYLEADEEPVSYLEQALAAIEDIHSRGKVAILCGGSTSLTEPLLLSSSVKRCNPLIITLFTDMETLGRLTDSRIDSMIQEGLLEEIKDLKRMHNLLVPDRDLPIGYPELAPCFDDNAETYQHGFHTLPFRVESKATFKRDVEERALELVPQWLMTIQKQRHSESAMKERLHADWPDYKTPIVNGV